VIYREAKNAGKGADAYAYPINIQHVKNDFLSIPVAITEFMHK